MDVPPGLARILVQNSQWLARKERVTEGGDGCTVQALINPKLNSLSRAGRRGLLVPHPQVCSVQLVQTLDFVPSSWRVHQVTKDLHKF